MESQLSLTEIRNLLIIILAKQIQVEEKSKGEPSAHHIRGAIKLYKDSIDTIVREKIDLS